jgi:hypothetical protein
VQEIKLASENSRKSDDENRHRLDSIEASVNDLYKRTGRPGPRSVTTAMSARRHGGRRALKAIGCTLFSFPDTFLLLLALKLVC